MKNKGCDTCRYEHHDIQDYPCNKCAYSYIDKYEPKTNADKIRDMSDEELAERINTKTACEQCAYGRDGCKEMRCAKGILEWLQSEAE